MWTDEQREKYKRPGGGFPSDVTDAEWAVLGPLIPDATPGGRPRKTNMRSAMNAILLSAADRLSMALPAAGRLSSAFDGVQHLPQVPG